MTSDNTGNNATSPNGLKYKPIMNRKLADVIENAGIVHMFEFTTVGWSGDYLGNLASAVSGKNSGKCSHWRQIDFYNSETKRLEAVAGSAIIGKCPIRLFDVNVDVGILIDPALAHFSYICETDVKSKLTDKGTIILPIISAWGGVTPKENLGEEGKCHFQTIEVPIHRNEADRKTLSEFFNGKFLDRFKRWRKGDMPQHGYTQKCFLHNEVGVNFPKEAVKAVLVYSYGSSAGDKDYEEKTPSCYEKSFEEKITGMMLANLFVEVVKRKGGAALPVLHYDLDRSGELKINEIELEPRKVARVLEEDAWTRVAYEHFLGAKKVQDIILGKTVKEPGVG